MSRSSKQRVQTRFARLSKPEQAALDRVQMRRFDIDRVQLSDAAAIRRMSTVSPMARRLVWGMVAYLSMHETTRAELTDAAYALGFRSALWQTIDELHAAGLMTSKTNGNVVMHTFFTGLGHAVRRRGDGYLSDGSGGTVLRMTTAEAG
jgi:hypothetical protein